jgi:hypothetical protein
LLPAYATGDKTGTLACEIGLWKAGLLAKLRRELQIWSMRRDQTCDLADEKV